MLLWPQLLLLPPRDAFRRSPRDAQGASEVKLAFSSGGGVGAIGIEAKSKRHVFRVSPGRTETGPFGVFVRERDGVEGANCMRSALGEAHVEIVGDITSTSSGASMTDAHVEIVGEVSCDV